MTCFIRSACLYGYEEIVRGYGCNPSQLLKNAGIIASQLRDPDTFIVYEHFLKALEQARMECNNDVFGLELGLKQSIQQFGMLKNYMYRQATILDAMNILNKYIHMYAEGFTLDITPSEQCYKIRFNHLHQEYFTAQKAQFSLAACFHIFCELLGRSVHVPQMSLKQSEPLQDTRYFEQKFGCKIEFNAEEDVLYLPVKLLLEKPTIPIGEKTTEPLLGQNLEIPSHLKIMEFIQQTIKSLLATGECNKKNIALCLGLHPKKLQRLLSAHNTSYREIIEQVRKQEAIKLLKQPHISVTLIALKLGYGELAIFSRNFKTWFNQTPSQWRQQNGLS